MRQHLAIITKSAAEAILSGKKTVETRFSKHKISPFLQVASGDLVYLKPPGGEILGQFMVKKVIYFDGLEPVDIDQIFKDYGQRISSGDKVEDGKYQMLKAKAAYASLIFIKESKRLITSPIRLKKKDLRGWVVLEK